MHWLFSREFGLSNSLNRLRRGRFGNLGCQYFRLKLFFRDPFFRFADRFAGVAQVR